MTNQDLEKTCQTCRYHSQHYSKRNTGYGNVCCGHCLHNSNIRRKPLGSCEHWENIEIKKQERKLSIIETINSMSERLNEIAAILKDDLQRG